MQKYKGCISNPQTALISYRPFPSTMDPATFFFNNFSFVYVFKDVCV